MPKGDFYGSKFRKWDIDFEFIEMCRRITPVQATVKSIFEPPNNQIDSFEPLEEQKS